ASCCAWHGTGEAEPKRLSIETKAIPDIAFPSRFHENGMGFLYVGKDDLIAGKGVTALPRSGWKHRIKSEHGIGPLPRTRRSKGRLIYGLRRSLGFPLICQTLRLFDLRLRHLLGDGFPRLIDAVTHRWLLVPLCACGGEDEPLVGLHAVFRQSVAVEMHQPEVKLGPRVALIGGLAKPERGCRVVLRRAL